MSRSGVAGANLTVAGVVIPDAISHASIQAALTSAAISGAKVTASGSYITDQTLVITGECDLSRLTITYTGAGVACQIGTPGAVTFHKTIHAPQVINNNKTSQGWAQVVGSVGYDLVNLDACPLVMLPFARCFETGAQVRGAGQGCAYNTIQIGQLDNNSTNLKITADSTGYATQNTFLGGRLSYWNTEGVQVTGTRQIQLDITTLEIDNTTFVGLSLEGDTPEWHANISGVSNLFLNCRWEVSAGNSPRVQWQANATRNVITSGYLSGSIVETMGTGASGNTIMGGNSWRLRGSSNTSPVFGYLNGYSSSAPVWGVYDPVGGDSSPTTAYVWKASAQLMAGKRYGDSYDRIQLDNIYGRIFFGDATAAPTRYLGAYGGLGVVFGGTNVGFSTDGGGDLGFGSNRPNFVRAVTGISIANHGIYYGTTAPTTGSYSVGDRVFNSAPAVGSAKSWVCTVSGSPGTWVSEGNL